VPVPADFPSPPSITVQRCRPRIEVLYARTERSTDDLPGIAHRCSVSRDNTTTMIGVQPADTRLRPEITRSIERATSLAHRGRGCDGTIIQISSGRVSDDPAVSRHVGGSGSGR
jgi:hypothetical protein